LNDHEALIKSEGPAGLLLCRDLIFISKVTGTAHALGRRVVVLENSSVVLKMLTNWVPKFVFVDLSAGELVSAASIAAYREIAGPKVPFLAFGSHVDTQALTDARNAGCDPVMPRSRFSNELPSLISHYFGEGQV
jgi:hypothetical protein